MTDLTFILCALEPPGAVPGFPVRRALLRVLWLVMVEVKRVPENVTGPPRVTTEA